jgi:hypothetical protein
MIIKVVRSLGLGLDEKAIEAVAKWKFRPGMKNGQSVAVQATIEVSGEKAASISPYDHHSEPHVADLPISKVDDVSCLRLN